MRLIDADAFERAVMFSDDEDLQDVIYRLRDFPSAQPERKPGHWILVKGSNGKDYHKCSCCLHTQEITGVKNYCPVCGADMMGVEHETVRETKIKRPKSLGFDTIGGWRCGRELPDGGGA